MIPIHKFRAGVMLIASAALITACGSKEVDDLPPPATGAAGAAPVTDTIRPGSQQDFINSVGMGNDRIFFDTDRYNIDAADQVTLQTQAQWLARNQAAQITIEGHADERGTRDYNLALGERRANSAKNYLVSLGVSPARIRTVSYGKERPQALGSDAQAWAQNRRAVTIVVN